MLQSRAKPWACKPVQEGTSGCLKDMVLVVDLGPAPGALHRSPSPPPRLVGCPVAFDAGGRRSGFPGGARLFDCPLLIDSPTPSVGRPRHRRLEGHF
jgi:hypothetical protein